MTDLMHVISSPEAESGFYPTPPHLVRRMLDQVDWKYVSSILEPSAGKGDLAIPAAKRSVNYRNEYDDKKLAKVDLDCIEIDSNLRAILRDKGLRVVHDDFLTFRTAKRYSLILMNPPFEDGALHLLKALSFLADGGQIVCLLNAETIRNPYTNDRRKLLEVLGDEARVEYIPDAFLTGERKTDVETAMVVYRKPAAKVCSGIIMENLKPAHRFVDMPEEESKALTKEDFVDAIVDRYNYEVECGLALISEWRSIYSLLSRNLTKDAAYGTPVLTLTMGGRDSVSENEFIRATRKKYWSALFGSNQFMKQLTTNLQELLRNKIEELSGYEFSTFNIYELMIQMNAKMSSGVEETILDLFDDWTRKYSWSNEFSKNRHYFDGWKTNDAFAVNKRVIIPLRAYESWNKWNPDEFRAYNVREKLKDIEKVFNYLDGGRTPEKDLETVLSEIEKTGEAKNVDSKYFKLTFYKKGTCHLEFKNMDLLAKFNIFAARGKSWLPPAFGKKHYKDLNAEEKKTVDSFMGDNAGKKYDAVCAHADYFLQAGSDVLNLTA